MAKIKGAGTKLEVDVASTITPIGQRVNISGPDINTNTLEVTDLDSTAREYAPLLPDNGKLTMQVWWDPLDDTHKLLAQWVQSSPSPTQSWTMTWSTTPPQKATFDGFVSRFNIGGQEVDGYLTSDVEITITGPVTFVATP